jgi:hypothetical protein
MTGDANYVNKTPVWGVLDREQRKVRATVVGKVNRKALQTAVLDQVAPGSSIFTDEASALQIVAEGIHSRIRKPHGKVC